MSTFPKMKQLGLAVIGFSLVTPALAKTTLWVSPDGNDTAPASVDRPVATLARVHSLLEERTRAGADDEFEIRMRGGVYPLTETLVLTSRELGSGTRKISFVAHDAERVVVTGSRRLTGEWRRADGNLWSLEIPAAAHGRWIFRSLFQAGRSLPRAREPDEGFWQVRAVDAERRTLTLRERLPAEFAGVSGAELNTTAWWHFNRQPVAAITVDRITALRPIGTDVSSFRINEKSHSRVWLENALPFADTPGEWFLDTAKGVLHYRAAEGEDPNRSAFSAPRLRELIVVRGEATQPVRNVHFAGLEFAETDWELPAEGRLGLQAGAWAFDRSRTYSPGAALRFIYATGGSVQGCTFVNLGDGAIALEIGTRDCLVAHCEFRQVGSNVVQVGRMPEYTGEGHPLHRDFAALPVKPDQQGRLPPSGEIWRIRTETVPEAPANIRIIDNTLIDCGHLDYGSVGIWVGYAHHVAIEHNLLRGLPYTAISVGWRWGPGLTNCHSHLIRRNRIDQIMQQAGDGGGIYLVGEQPGTRVWENYISHSGRNYWAHGIYPDECSDHMDIAGNYVNQVMDHSIFMNKNGPHQVVRDNNGEAGPTKISGAKASGSKWVKFVPERTPADLEAYGPRRAGRR
jgi:hypothetical protein